ncbi:XopAW family type III secretion system calcium-binding effector [Pseudomonas cucumis]|uniref:XopAW family type III secretion system calcium-binding effector n=1 Tax=Pseudomonas cucumis TaxID=2954082 RepID=UPI002736051A|nr:XopAW family type III secretion system calcium-binding effector [Pseudomonas cucumis]WLG89123.1 XopAW family type III secretion system calcium-binding effector [Pseudomonas cucumis]
MIGSVSNYTSYTSTSSTSTNSARSQQFQKELLAKLDSNSDGAVDQDELTSALSQKTDDGLLISLSKNFSDLDSDESGSLSSEEMAAMAPPPPPRDQAPSTELADALISALDTDGDSAISSDELSNGLTSAGSTADSTEIFSALDKNEDGTVSQDELVASLTPTPPPPQQMSSEELFSQLDTDSDGSVTATELSSALASDSTSSTSTDTSAALLKVLDSDSSGGVSSDELKAALQAGREQNTDSSTNQFNVTEALNKMIANLSKQYSLDNVATVGKYLNVAT